MCFLYSEAPSASRTRELMILKHSLTSFVVHFLPKAGCVYKCFAQHVHKKHALFSARTFGTCECLVLMSGRTRTSTYSCAHDSGVFSRYRPACGFSPKSAVKMAFCVGSCTKAPAFLRSRFRRSLMFWFKRHSRAFSTVCTVSHFPQSRCSKGYTSVIHKVSHSFPLAPLALGNLQVYSHCEAFVVA